MWNFEWSEPCYSPNNTFITQHSKFPRGLLPRRIRPCYIRVMTMQFQKIDPRVTITTPFGEIKIRFYPDDAPRHVENFLKLAKMGFYDGTTFHRVVPGFIIQGGDPLSKTADRSLHGSGSPGYWLNPETSDRPHKRGAIGMAKVPRESNSTRDPNDNGSQFYICVDDNSGLDRTYTVFGEVFRGMEVVDKIVAAARDEFDNPLKPIPMTLTVKE
jgi:peptidyl-prolyl cis-trans isomerase B (cyclophilin B)